MRGLVLGSIVLLVGIIGAAILLGDADTALDTSLEVSEALATDTAGFATAAEPRHFHFPADHGPHPDYRTEWWYYTGNLQAADGRHFGYQLTFFRTALRPGAGREAYDPSAAGGPSEPDGDSSGAIDVKDAAGRSDDGDAADSTWSSRQLYMAHFAVSDAAEGRFESFERFSRAAAGLAGAQASPFRVWLEDWSASGSSADSLVVRAREAGISIDLRLRRLKPIVLQGDAGLDRKGPQPGNASYYYSMTRMATSGTLRFGSETYVVEGLTWMDREWSTSALGPDQEGWDWFALQLLDGRDVMYYRLRRQDGSTSPYSGGTIVEADGSQHPLTADDVGLAPSAFWKSDATDRRYPIEWSFEVPSHALNLVLRPYVREQEVDQSVTYWEGAVRVSGSDSGYGFVEMTGYASEPSSSFFGR